MNHIGMSKEQFLGVLDDLRAAVAADDSFEGSLEYLMPGPLAKECPDCGGSGEIHRNLSTGDPRAEESKPCPTCEGDGVHPDEREFARSDFAVRAAYRVGNSMGQGSVRSVGTMPPASQ